MCSPVGATIGAGAGLQIIGAVRGANVQAATMRNNAQIAKWNARDAIRQGAYAARRVEIEGRAVAAEQRAALAGAGVEGGTVDAVELESAVNAARDADAAKANAARAAWGFRNEARDLKRGAREARTAGILGAFGAGLSAAGTIADYQSRRGTPT